MIDLLNLEPTKVSRDLRGKIILLYGEYKSGKTYNASKFPKVLLLAFEKGYNAIDGVHVVPINKWTEFKTVLKQLKQDAVKEKFQTVVADTVDIAYQLCEDFICQREGVENIKDVPWGGGYAMVEKEFDDCLREIVMLDYGLVMISHEEDKNFKDENGEEYQKIVPTLAKRPRKVVLRMTDINGYSKTIETETGFKQILYMRGTPRFEAGSRWKYMPDKIEFTYDNLVKAIDDAITKQADLDGAQVVDQHINVHKEREMELSFDELMNEVKEICTALMGKDSDKNRVRIQTIVNKGLGMGKKLFDATPEQKDIVAMIYDELKSLL